MKYESSDFPLFERIWLLLFGAFICLASIYSSARAIHDGHFSIQGTLVVLGSTALGVYCIWMAIFRKGYTQSQMDATPFAAPPEYSPDSFSQRFRQALSMRSLGGIIVDHQNRMIHLLNCYNPSPSQTERGEAWHSCPFDEVTGMTIGFFDREGLRRGERWLTIRTRSGTAKMISTKALRANLRLAIPGMLAADTRPFHAVYYVLLSALLAYLLVDILNSFANIGIPRGRTAGLVIGTLVGAVVFAGIVLRARAAQRESTPDDDQLAGKGSQ